MSIDHTENSNLNPQEIDPSLQNEGEVVKEKSPDTSQAETQAIRKPVRKSKPVPANADETLRIDTDPQSAPPSEFSAMDEFHEVAPAEELPDEIASLPSSEGSPTEPAESEQTTGKVKRGKWIWLGLLGVVVLVLIGSALGYGSAMRTRKIEAENQRLLLATTQFELGKADQQAGRYEIARKRFEYVLSIYPEFPGIDEKLVEIGLVLAQNQGGSVVTTPQAEGTPSNAVTPIPTKDTRSVSILVNQAEAQLKAKDWDGLYTTLSTIREIDPEYNAMNVDGMLYLALRNRGIRQVQAGNLEPGMFSFALAKQLAPIDTDAESYRIWAKLYLNAGSNWVANWQKAVEGFAYLYPLVPQLRDSSGITVTQRYARALIGYGDTLQISYDYCGAATSYSQALSIYAETGLPEKLAQAKEYCANPPVIPTPTVDPSASSTAEPTP